MKLSPIPQTLKSFLLISAFTITTAHALEREIRNPFDAYTEDHNNHRIYHFIPSEPLHWYNRESLSLRKLDLKIQEGTVTPLTVQDLLTTLTPSALGSKATLSYIVKRLLSSRTYPFDTTVGRFENQATQNFFENVLNAIAYLLRASTLATQPPMRSINIPSYDPPLATTPKIDMDLYLITMVRHYGSQASPQSLAHAFSQNTLAFLFQGINPNGSIINPALMGHLVSVALFSKFSALFGENSLFREPNNDQLINTESPNRGNLGILPEAKALLRVNDQGWEAINISTTNAITTFSQQFKEALLNRIAILDLYRQRFNEFKERFMQGGCKGLVALSNQFNNLSFDPTQALSDNDIILETARQALNLSTEEEVLTGNETLGLNKIDMIHSTYDQWRTSYFDPNNTGRAYVQTSLEPNQQMFIEDDDEDTREFWNEILQSVTPFDLQRTIEDLAHAIKEKLEPERELLDFFRNLTQDLFFVFSQNVPYSTQLGVRKFIALGQPHYIGENQIGKALYYLRNQVLEDFKQAFFAEARTLLNLPQEEEVLTGNGLYGLDKIYAPNFTYEEWREAYFNPNNTGRAYVRNLEDDSTQLFIRDRTRHLQLTRMFHAIWNAVTADPNYHELTVPQLAQAIRNHLAPPGLIYLSTSPVDFFFVLSPTLPYAAEMGIVRVNISGAPHYIGENRIGKALTSLRSDLRQEAERTTPEE